ADFKSLNIEWLEAYFQVEPIDHQVLSHPATEIIQPGGHIFMAERQGKTIGTYAFIKKSDGVYEFSKMAIDPTLRGMGFGQFMLDHALTWAKVNRWTKILLYSNTKLENAIHLYRKNGFVEIPLEKEVIYSRGNIKMEYSIH
ncbi:MAG: GNAT family N-acetyltransferase, partial [Flavobacteriaceae bacterium]